MDEFGAKAKSSLKSGFDFLKGKAKEAVDLTKLHGDIKRLQARRDEYLLDIGHRVFVMFEMDRFEPDGLKPRVDEIRELNREIESLPEEAQAVKARKGSEEKEHPPESH
jgi:hypothetical protein